MNCMMCQSLIAQWGRGKEGSETWAPRTFPFLGWVHVWLQQKSPYTGIPLALKNTLGSSLAEVFLKAPWATLVVSKVTGGVRTLKIFLIRLIFLFTFLQANFTGFWAQLNLLIRWCLLVHGTMTDKFQENIKTTVRKKLTLIFKDWTNISFTLFHLILKALWMLLYLLYR